MLKSKNRKIISVILMLLMVFTSLGAAVAAGESDIEQDNNCDERITKNVTNLDGCNDTIVEGNRVNFTINVTSDRTSSTQYRVDDDLDHDLQFISYVASQGTYNSGTGIWDIGNLTFGQSAILSIIARVMASDENIQNTAELERNDRHWHNGYWSHGHWHDGYWEDDWKDYGDAWVHFYVPRAADLGITKTVNNSNPCYNDLVDFTVTAKNNGPNYSYYTNVTDLLPEGLEFVSYTATAGTYNSATGKWTIGTLYDGVQRVLHIIARVVTTDEIINNTASITGTRYDPCLANNTASVLLTVPALVDLGITKTVNNTNPKLNDLINFTINATNNGPDDATGVTVNDLLPAGLQFVSYTATQGIYNETTGIWDIGEMEEYTSVLLNIIAKVVLSNTNITNTANITGDECDPCLANNTANTTISVPAQSNLYLNITAPTQCLGLNDIAQIIFKVGNYGPDTADYTNVTWVIPEGMEFVSANVDVGTFVYDAATRTLTWNLGNVPVGDPYMWLFVKVLKEGDFLINPTLSTTTYDPTLGTNVQFRNICVEAAGGEETIAAATVGMQNTGAPIGLLVLALLAVLGGLIVPRRKK